MVTANHVDMSDYLASSIALATYKGHLWGMPIEQDQFSLFINVPEFKASGLTKYPQTMSELLADAVKLTKNDSSGRITQLGLGFEQPVPATGGLEYLAPYFNGDWYNAATKTVTPDSPGIVAALKWETQYLSKIGVQAYENFWHAKAHNPQGDLWIDGNEAMSINGDWMTKNTYEYNKTLKWTVAPPPYADGHPEWKNSTAVIGTFNVIPTGASHAKEAFQLITCLGTTAPELALNNIIGNTPSIKSAGKIMATGVFKQFIDLAGSPRTFPFPVLPIADQYQNAQIAAEDKVRRGQDTAEHALGQVKQTIQAALNAAQ
jgi:ABC-type glycerol-3-phosphate transport system substrate-binding protein